MCIYLSDLQIGERARVCGFNQGSPHYLQQLLAMGLVPGAEFVVIRAAPLGDPIQIKLNAIALCLRKREGAILQLERVNARSCHP